MNTIARPENTERLLEKHGQSHLLAFWEQLDEAASRKLLAQINELDFSEIDGWTANIIKKPPPEVPPDSFAPASSYPPEPANTAQQREYDEAEKLGRELISAGKVAAFVVAGGQGTRLGLAGPKGDFPVSPVRNKTLFRVFAESVAAVAKKYDTCCPWYVMTSPLNHAETVEIFRRNDYYGLNPQDVFLFQQGTLPNFNADGKILLQEKATIACSPDGHGGSLKALHKSGAAEDMKKRGIEFISYWQVDNPLIRIFDPLFIGLHALNSAEMSSKALIKTGPEEKVGVFTTVDSKVTVIEYSDLPKELAQERNPDGSLLFGLGSIAIHIINVDFVEKLNRKGFSLPLHRAVKKIPHIDQLGNPVVPSEPNGIKLETFVFDALPLASSSVILQTLRSEEFAPVKNAAGADSPETSRAAQVARAANWLESAGVKIPRNADGSPDCILEIAPSFALEKDDVKSKLDRIPQIKPGDKLYLA